MSVHDDVLRRFAQAKARVNRLVDRLPKERLAEVAWLLALNVAHDQRPHGEIPLVTMQHPTARSGAEACFVDGCTAL